MNSRFGQLLVLLSCLCMLPRIRNVSSRDCAGSGGKYQLDKLSDLPYRNANLLRGNHRSDLALVVDILTMDDIRQHGHYALSAGG